MPAGVFTHSDSVGKPIFITSCNSWLFQGVGEGALLIFTPSQPTWFEGNGNPKAAKGVVELRLFSVSPNIVCFLLKQVWRGLFFAMCPVQFGPIGWLGFGGLGTGCAFSRNRGGLLDSVQRAGFCEAEARCLLQHESYVAVRARQDTEFASGVEWKDFLLLFLMYQHMASWLGQPGCFARVAV